METRRRGRGGRSFARQERFGRGGGGGGGQNRWLNRREAVPSRTWTPTSPSKTGRKDGTHRSGSRTTASRPPRVGPSSSLLTAPVELPTPLVAPVEQGALKRKATSPLMPRQTPTRRPISPTTPPRWELAHARVKGRFRDYITPPLETIEPLSCRWQQLPKEMDKVNIGLVDEGSRSTLVITHLHGELYQQVVIDRRVDNDICHLLLRYVFFLTTLFHIFFFFNL